ncbi:C2H2 type zinc finger domain protein [Aspergillus sclerotiicarbonarius CBS 121057]|uniref:C2H2 type zinc finger domain protein n=1 Tax=Aspergillus sclerotiicarbonarius (strain CBS 121057 / IBT 28362) TaxID=1448318 RepID=A0A319DXW4_ASPSB|nr:C2H2 type zinc finger domain protein [Aspergillus sclerotiicarbonarius CBS 121057]
MTARTSIHSAMLLMPGGSSTHSTMSSEMQPYPFPAAAFQQAPLSDVRGLPGAVPYAFDQIHPIQQRSPDMGALYFQDQFPHQTIPPQSFGPDIEPFPHKLPTTTDTYYPVHQEGWLAGAAPGSSPNSTDYHLPSSTQSSFSQSQLTPITCASLSSTTTDLDFELDLDLDLDDINLQSLSDTSSARTQTRDLTNYGIQNPDGTWRCAYPGCSSHAVFRRGCDLRKHYNRHRKHLFCRYEGCPQAMRGGFSSKKDRDRHEAKHNPEIPCEWDGCQRVFSRVDNMKDHVRRIHKRRES